MSGMKSSHASLTRRTFVKGAVAAGALGVAAGGMATTANWLAPAQAVAEPEDKVTYMCHQFHCLSGCCLKCTTRDGRLVKIEPNDACEERDQRICVRGLSEVQHVYANDRLQTPLKRVGERGEGKFEAISWDEAIKTVADAIKESQKKYGEQSVFYRKCTEPSVAHGVEWLVQLLRAESGGNWGLDRGHTNGLVPAVGYYAHLYSRSIWEWPQASTILMVGHNICESGMTYAQCMFDAQEAGAKVIVVDPRYSVTAAKADQWIPINPGTDPALMLGMLAVIVEKGWYDEDFAKANTSFPFLVERKSGKIFADEKAPLETPHLITGDTVYTAYVYDTKTKSAKHYDDKEAKAALEGSWTLDGKEVVTEFTLLKEWIAKNGYSAAWASEITGIDEQVIIDLADQYANGGPAYIEFGLGGPDKYYNADVDGHAMGILTALTGNYGKPGTGLGFFGGIEPTAASGLGAWALPEEFHYGDTGLAMYELPDMKDCPIHCAITFGDAFTLEAANANKFLEWVKTLDFFAIADIYHSSVIDYADIVMPACTKFECPEEIYHIRETGMGYVSLATKTIDPLFESKTDLEIERLIAAEFGLDKYMPQSYEEYADALLKDSPYTKEQLLANQGVIRIPGMETLPDGRGDQVYPTPSTKFEVYYENLLEQGHAFPVYDPPIESDPNNEKFAEYPLQFMQGKSRFRIHAYFSASTWLQEFIGPCVNISPADAAARGIKTGDDMHVFNDRGEFIAKALVNPGIKEGTLFMFETTYNTYYKDGFLQNVTNDARNQRCYEMRHGPQILYNDTLVQVEKA